MSDYSNEEFSDEAFSDDDEGGKKQKIYSQREKLIIMQTCCKNPRKLYEKFNRDVNRNTQKEEWEKVSNEIIAAGIDAGGIKNLRKNVTNWTRRALAASDRLKNTGTGKMKPLTELQLLCIEFVKAAKGESVVDYINGPEEPSGTTSAVTPGAKSTADEITTRKDSELGHDLDRSNEDSVLNSSLPRTHTHKATTTKRTAVWMEALQSKEATSTSRTLPEAGTSGTQKSMTSPHMSKKKKFSNEKENRQSNEIVQPSKTYITDWKKSVVDLETKRFKSEDRKRQLECYNLALQNMSLERQLELSGDEIAMIRSEVAPELLTYPNYTTEFLDLTDDTAMPNESHETDDHAK